jgi:hypothetical protein
MLHQFIMLASMIVTAATEQCCDHGVPVEQGSVACVGRDQKIEFEGCYQDVQVVDLKQTTKTSYGGQVSTVYNWYYSQLFIKDFNNIWHPTEL